MMARKNKKLQFLLFFPFLFIICCEINIPKIDLKNAPESIIIKKKDYLKIILIYNKINDYKNGRLYISIMDRRAKVLYDKKKTLHVKDLKKIEIPSQKAKYKYEIVIPFKKLRKKPSGKTLLRIRLIWDKKVLHIKDQYIYF